MSTQNISVLIFFLKNVKYFALQKIFTFFNKKYLWYTLTLIIYNEMLTNDVIIFKQPGQEYDVALELVAFDKLLSSPSYRITRF